MLKVRKASRDVFNEKPTREEQTIATATTQQESFGNSAIMHTTFGDIYIRLFPVEAPLATKNFTILAKTGYYCNVIFHRVIKGFMCQTGDPNGDGTGGVSAFGGEAFKDEFHASLCHDEPYVISMANSGPDTNQAQFFITTAATPWLDKKHTIFGKCVGGTDVVQRIEIAKCDRRDRPEVPIKIISIEMR